MSVQIFIRRSLFKDFNFEIKVALNIETCFGNSLRSGFTGKNYSSENSSKIFFKRKNNNNNDN